jgi:hypothetical protein
MLRLFRGAALSSIKGGMPVAVLERTIILYHDEEVWKQRLAVSDDELLFLPWARTANSRAFTDTEFAQP